MRHTSIDAWEQCNHTRKNELNRYLVHALEQPPIYRMEEASEKRFRQKLNRNESRGSSLPFSLPPPLPTLARIERSNRAFGVSVDMAFGCADGEGRAWADKFKDREGGGGYVHVKVHTHQMTFGLPDFYSKARAAPLTQLWSCLPYAAGDVARAEACL